MAVPTEEVAQVFAHLGDLEKEFAALELKARKPLRNNGQRTSLTRAQCAAENSSCDRSSPNVQAFSIRFQTSGQPSLDQDLKKSYSSSRRMTLPSWPS